MARFGAECSTAQHSTHRHQTPTQAMGAIMAKDIGYGDCFDSYRPNGGQNADSPLSCSMKHTLPWALKASVSGVMQSVWKSEDRAMPCSEHTHSTHTASTSSSDRQLSRRERMSAKDTFSYQSHTHEIGK